MDRPEFFVFMFVFLSVVFRNTPLKSCNILIINDLKNESHRVQLVDNRTLPHFISAF
jgi:hypothetical protein